MIYEKADGGEQAAAAINTAGITMCNESHSVRFFCQQCDIFLCDDCFFLRHYQKNKAHEVEEIKESIRQETSKVGLQMEELKQFAESAEREANGREQKANESIDALIELVSEVERHLMISESNPEAQLRHLKRTCLASLQYADQSTRDIDPEDESVAAFVSRHRISAFLNQEIKDSHQVIDKVKDNPPPDPVFVIVKSIFTIVGLKKLEGCLNYLKKFIHYVISLAKKYNGILQKYWIFLKIKQFLPLQKHLAHHQMLRKQLCQTFKP